MSNELQYQLNTNSVRNLLKYGSVALSSLADKLRVPQELLTDYRDGQRVPESKFADAIAEAFGVNKYALYTNEEYVPQNNFIDFRKSALSTAKLSVDARNALAHSQRVLKLAAYAGAKRPDIPEIDVSKRHVTSIANAMRKHFAISDVEQLSCESRADFFKILRKNIERKNIFVWAVSVDIEDFRGACISESDIWAILFNSKDHNYGARSFTLAHELVHVCLGAMGISDPYLTNNDLEKFCNRVAARMLAPRRMLRNIDQNHYFGNDNPLDYIRYFANKTNLSQYMIAIRLKEIRLIDDLYFDKWFYLYMSLEKRPKFLLEPPDPQGGSGKAPDQGKVKIAKFGALLPILIITAVHARKISSVEVMKHMGLKRRFFDQTLNAAQEFLDAA